MKRVAIIVILVVGLAWPASAQLAVIDPANLANALLRYAELQQTVAQLITTYQQIRTQYLLLLRQSQQIPVIMNVRYRALPTPWLPFAAADAYGTTAGLIGTANNGYDAATTCALSPQPLTDYG